MSWLAILCHTERTLFDTLFELIWLLFYLADAYSAKSSITHFAQVATRATLVLVADVRNFLNTKND